MQRELLSTLGQITKNLCLHERETLNVLSIAEPYLNKHQNPTLQVNIKLKNIFKYINYINLFIINYFIFIGILYKII